MTSPVNPSHYSRLQTGTDDGPAKEVPWLTSRSRVLLRRKDPLTRALRAEIEASLKQQFDETLHDRERELRANYESRLEEDLQRAQADAAKRRRRGSRRNSPG